MPIPKDARDSKPYWIPSGVSWVRTLLRCREIPTPTGWRPCAAVQKAAARPPWPNLRKTLSAPFRLAGK